MLGFLAELLGTFWKPIAGLLGGAVALLLLYLRGRADAKKDSVVETQREIIRAHETRDETDAAVAAADDAERQRLRNKWRRSDD